MLKPRNKGAKNRSQKKSTVHKAYKDFQDYSERKAKYLEAQETFGGINSYSKTDKDTTFMRTKDDYMQNGQLKPRYNIQFATEQKFALSYQAFPYPSDTKTLIPFLNTIQASYDLPKYLVADADYGSEENYQYILDEVESIPLITYNTYLKEQTKKVQKDVFRKENWPYNEMDDFFFVRIKKITLQKLFTAKRQS